MELSRTQKYIYYYIRYALIVWPFLLLLAVYNAFWGPSIYEGMGIIDIIVISISIPCYFAFFGILPGIIYGDKWKGPFVPFSLINFEFTIFFAVTAGLGPTYIFFKKFDPLFREYFKEQNHKKKTS